MTLLGEMRRRILTHRLPPPADRRLSWTSRSRTSRSDVGSKSSYHEPTEVSPSGADTATTTSARSPSRRIVSCAATGTARTSRCGACNLSARRRPRRSRRSRGRRRRRSRRARRVRVVGGPDGRASPDRLRMPPAPAPRQPERDRVRHLAGREQCRRELPTDITPVPEPDRHPALARGGPVVWMVPSG